MKKLLLRSVVFSTLLAFLCGAISHRYMPRVEAMAAPAADMDPHMSMTKLRPLQPGDKARADAVVAAAKKAAEHYRDYRAAEADGYTIFMPDQHQNVYHFVRESADPETKVNFDPNRPPALLYTKTDGPNPDYKLVGVMYTAPYGATEEELNARIPLSIAQWHEHINMCSTAAGAAQLARGRPTVRAERLYHHSRGLQSGGWAFQATSFRVDDTRLPV